VYINTDLHRATLLDEDVAFPLDNPGAWMAAHKPFDSEEEEEKAARALFWWTYFGCIGLIALLLMVAFA
jgi:hypothetical protein